MGIKLDWEVESEGGWDEVGEDPQAIEARRRRARRMRNVLLVILAILLVVGSIVAYRLFTVGQQVREALKATVAAETLALRIGDREAYLDAQSTLGGWRQLQAQAFQQYESEGARVEVTGEIDQMDISADQARVTLREVVDGKAYHVMWFYQRDASGWKHVPPDPRFWGAGRERNTTYFDFEYSSEDQALVDVLAAQFSSWWKTACDQTLCTDRPPSIDVKVEPDRLARLGWADYDANTLIIPSPLLGRFPADGKPDPVLMSQLADLIAYRWAGFLVGDEVQVYSELDWLRSEIHLWLWQSFDPTQPPAPLLTPLVQAYGEQIVPPLIERIKRRDPIVPVLQELTGANVADLPVGWELYLTYRLRAEVSLLQEDKETEAILLYRDPATAGAPVAFPLAESKIDTIQVVGLRRYGDLVWAETVFSGTPLESTGRTFEGTMTIFLPFRLLTDRWVRTVATEPDWGQVREERGTHVILRYYDLDAPTVVGLQAMLEETYDRVNADMGSLSLAQAQIWITGYDPQGYVSATRGNVLVQKPGPGEESSGSYEEFGLLFSSPYSTPYVSKGTIQESLRSVVMHDLTATLVRLQFVCPANAGHCADEFAMNILEGEGSSSPIHPLTYAFQQWELDHLGFVPENVPVAAQIGDYLLEAQSGLEALSLPPESLESLWPLSDAAYAMRDYVAARVLLDLLVERYGEGAVARLVPNLSQAISMDDWLYRSLGIHSADIEEDWLDRTKIVLRSTP